MTTSEQSDSRHEVDRLIALARGGSRDALGELLEGCRQYLLLVASEELEPALHPKAGPSDLVQETLLRAHAAFEQFQGASSPEMFGWLRQILLNNLASLRRRFHEAAKRELAREVRLDSGDPSTGGWQQVAADTPTPGTEAQNREEADALTLAIEQLPDHYRQVISLRYWDRLTFDEIGQRIGRSEEAARKIWRRAIDQLAEMLDLPS